MKLYSCSKCRNLLYFENNTCLTCGHAVGFEASGLSMLTLEPANDGLFSNLENNRQLYRFCQNAMHGSCNWLIPQPASSAYCLACSLNRVIPDLRLPENLGRWQRIEIAKHRLVYSLLGLRLPVMPKWAGQQTGIAFDFMADAGERVVTGHDNGIITLNIEEADEKLRIKHKQDLGEKYRTLLGHFRHEIGHYYWDIFYKDNPERRRAFTNLFGDATTHYSTSLSNYYEYGAPSNWNEYFISPYASAHPWEDWAETWSHYLHMIDTLETGWSFGVAIHPRNDGTRSLQTDIRQDPYRIADFNEIVNMWLPLTFAVNSLNRSMGHQDFYPFIISAPVIEKLRFIHTEIKNYSGSVAGPLL